GGAAWTWTLKGWRPRGGRRMTALQRPAALFFAAWALALLAFYPQRLFPGAWGTANRAQAFLFIGAALLLGLALVRLAGRPGERHWRRVLVGAIVVAICGGAISGATGPLLLSQPLKVRVDNAVIVPQGLNVATWATRELPMNSIYYGDIVTGFELAAHGAHRTFFGAASHVPGVLHSPLFAQWQRVELI